MDIIALMITYGGSNATITHGAGINNKNLSDIVLKLEFVNALGKHQVSSHYSMNNLYILQERYLLWDSPINAHDIILGFYARSLMMMTN